jgi:hypothetical protein
LRFIAAQCSNGPYLDCTFTPVKDRLSGVDAALIAAVSPAGRHRRRRGPRLALLLVLGAVLLVLPEPARADVRVEIVPALDLAAASAEGAAVGLLVPGWADPVSYAEALEALRSGRVDHPLRREHQRPLIQVAERGTPEEAGCCDVRIRLALPPPGEHPNDTRYPIAIEGGNFHGILTSPSTRITGLVSIGDVAPTVLGLDGRPVPDSVTGHALSSEPSSDPVATLQNLDERLRSTRDARFAATVAYAAIAYALIVAALALRSPRAGTAALLSLPAAATASLALSLAGVVSWWAFVLSMLALVAGGTWLARTRLAAGLLLVGVLAFHYIALLADGQALSLSLLGPNPDDGGRFFGLANELETILAGTTIVAAALLWERFGLGALIAVGGLALVTIAPNGLGASVTGAGVVVVGLSVLAVDLERRRGLIAVALAAGAAAAVLLLAPPEHLTGEPSRLLDRIELSARLAVESPRAMLVVFGLGLAPLLVIAWRYRDLRQRLQRADGASLLALLVATVASLVVNDSPDKVLAHGAAWCLVVVAYGLAGSRARRRGDWYRLAPVWVALPSSRPRR